MSERAFFDTNVFVYEFDPRVPAKQERSQNLVAEAVTSGSGVISYQVVQEFLNVMITKFENPLSLEDLTAYLNAVLWPMCAVSPTAELFAIALSIRGKTGWKFYDSLIVSAALEADCDILFTEDLQAGRIFEGLEIRNPFV